MRNIAYGVFGMTYLQSSNLVDGGTVNLDLAEHTWISKYMGLEGNGVRILHKEGIKLSLAPDVRMEFMPYSQAPDSFAVLQFYSEERGWIGTGHLIQPSAATLLTSNVRLGTHPQAAYNGYGMDKDLVTLRIRECRGALTLYPVQVFIEVLAD